MSKIVRSVGEVASKRATASTNCACNKDLWSSVATKAKCLPEKWSTAKGEAKELLGRYRSGEVTVEEMKTHATYVVIGGLLFFAGEVVGRGSLVGYKA